MPKNVEMGTLWVFFNIQFVAKYQKIKGALETLPEFFREKVPQCRKKSKAPSLTHSSRTGPYYLVRFCISQLKWNKWRTLCTNLNAFPLAGLVVS